MAYWTLAVGTTALLLFHAVGWGAAALAFWRDATLYVPRLASGLALALSLIVLRAAFTPRRVRRAITVTALVATAAAFVLVSLPQQFQGHGIMPGGTGTSASRASFEDRFRANGGSVSFHSHLSDVLITWLDGTYGRNEQSPARAYSALSRLAGVAFLLQLGLAGAWHGWSRQSCRYVALALATPLCLLYFGYWELGYLSMAAGVVPLLAARRLHSRIRAEAAPLLAGAIQGIHAAFHGFGMLGVAGGTLASAAGDEGGGRRLLRTMSFTSAAVALYLGWIFLYVTVGNLSITYGRELGNRPLYQTAIFDNRIANPLMSTPGLGEFGLFSLLSGVPLLAVALYGRPRRALVPTMLYALPGLVFQVRWWPVSAPFNLDLLLSVFPGVFAASWAIAASRRRSTFALVLLGVLHVALWTMLGNGMFARVWVEDVP